MDLDLALDVIERMKLAKIGEYEKWQKMIKKIQDRRPWNPGEVEYYTRLTRIYKHSRKSHLKNYHTKLSPQDSRPPCKTCSMQSEYYCNINDEYYCFAHVVGHDKNEG